MLNDDQVWGIPERFRASTDMTDEAAFALLQRNDAAQKELGERINAPFAQNTPLERQMSKAGITIETLNAVRESQELTGYQIESLAEAYATIGRYDLAADTTADAAKKATYETYWAAVFRPDDEWCPHPEQHKYVKEQIYSIKEQKEMPILACNVCRCLNVADSPAKLAEESDTRTRVRAETKGMTQEQVKKHLQQNYLKR